MPSTEQNAISWTSVYSLNTDGMSAEYESNVREALDRLQGTQEGQKIFRTLMEKNGNKHVNIKIVDTNDENNMASFSGFAALSRGAIYNSDDNTIHLNPNLLNINLYKDLSELAGLLGHESNHAIRQIEIENKIDAAPNLGREIVYRDNIEYIAQLTNNEVTRELNKPSRPYVDSSSAKMLIEMAGEKSSNIEDSISTLSAALVGSGELKQFENDPDNSRLATYMASLVPKTGYTAERIKEVLDGPSREMKRIAKENTGPSETFNTYNSQTGVQIGIGDSDVSVGRDTKHADDRSDDYYWIGQKSKNKGKSNDSSEGEITPVEKGSDTIDKTQAKQLAPKEVSVTGDTIAIDDPASGINISIKSPEVAKSIKDAIDRAAAEKVLLLDGGKQFAQLREAVTRLGIDGNFDPADEKEIANLASKISKKFEINEDILTQLANNKVCLSAFDGADGSKKDGKLTSEEIGAKMLKLGLNNSTVDQNNDGKFSYEELLQSVSKPLEFGSIKPGSGRQH